MSDQAPQTLDLKDLMSEAIYSVPYDGLNPGQDERVDYHVAALTALIEREREQARQEGYKKVDRLEVIDGTGRAYVKGSIYGSAVEITLSLQDDGRTLKVFVDERKEERVMSKDENQFTEVHKMVSTEYKSKCCDAPVVKYDASGGHKHWLGHQCAKCGNQAPLSTKDLLDIMGIRS